MNDDDLINYYGESLRKYEDDECTEMMEYHILPDNFFGKDFRISQEDEKLLISYAPKLFNTMKKENAPLKHFYYTNNKALESAMWGLVNKFYSYRHFNDPDYFDNRLKRVHSKSYANKKMDEKVQKFKNHINYIIELMGGEASKNEGVHLKKHLQHALEYPHSYIFEKEEYKGCSIQKDTIEKYLLSLKLDLKSNTIKKFIKAIN